MDGRSAAAEKTQIFAALARTAHVAVAKAVRSLQVKIAPRKHRGIELEKWQTKLVPRGRDGGRYVFF
jgi:hypothetical protein